MARGEKTGTRTRTLSRVQKKKAAKNTAQKRAKLPSSFGLTWQVFGILRRFWKPLGGIYFVYLILNLIPLSTSGLGSTVAQIRAKLEDGDKFQNALSGYTSLFGSGGSTDSQIIQSILVISGSLVIIWALRQLLAGAKIGVKEAYYRSMAPLIPFILVLGVIFIQLLPLTLGVPVVGAVLNAILNPGAVLSILFVTIFVVLALWSFYMISSSIFALYIVTLPDMQPRQALRSAKNLVKFRRWQLMPKVLFLPIFIFVAMAMTVVPLILLASFLVAPVFYVLSMLAILFVHTYLYSLYRSLLE
jgi:hypothetical protein